MALWRCDNYAGVRDLPRYRVARRTPYAVHGPAPAPDSPFSPSVAMPARSIPASFQSSPPAAFLREYSRWTVCGASSGARDGLGERSGIPFGSPLAIIDDKCNLLHARTHMRRQADECEVTRASIPNGKRHCPALTQPMGIASVVHTARRFPSFLVGPMQGAQGPRCRRCQANVSAFAQGNHPPAIARDASKEVWIEFENVGRFHSSLPKQKQRGRVSTSFINVANHAGPIAGDRRNKK
jgi:hypothetical protein